MSFPNPGSESAGFGTGLHQGARHDMSQCVKMYGSEAKHQRENSAGAGPNAYQWIEIST